MGHLAFLCEKSNLTKINPRSDLFEYQLTVFCIFRDLDLIDVNTSPMVDLDDEDWNDDFESQI